MSSRKPKNQSHHSHPPHPSNPSDILFFLPLGWTLIIAILSGMPGSSLPEISLWAFLSFDKLAHAFVYGVFAFLWAMAFLRQERYPILRKHYLWIAVLLGVFYGILMEVLQGTVFRERSMDWLDAVANTIGALFGVGAFRLLRGRSRRLGT